MAESKIKNSVIIALLGIAVFICFSRTWENSFLKWDDTKYILENPSTKGFSSTNIKTILTTPYQGNYIPVTFLAFNIERSAFGDSPKVFITINILLHFANCILVFFLVILLSRNKITAFLCALLFAIHPLHVESVAWMAEQKDVLYAFFFFLSLICYIKYANSKKWKWYVFSLLLMLLSAGSKTMGIVLPGIFIAYDFFIGRKWFQPKILLEKIPFLLVGIVFVWAEMHAVRNHAENLHSFNLSLIERATVACYAVIRYVFLLIAPVHLSAYYPYPMSPGDPFPVWIWFFVPLLLGITFLIYYFRKNKSLVFSSLFFILNLSLVLQIFPVGDSMMADRFVYVASVGFFLLTAVFLQKLFQHKKFKTILITTTGVYFLFLGTTTFLRCEIWKNDETLWSDVISKYDHVPLAFINHGNILFEKGNTNDAISDYTKAIGCGYDTKDAFFNRGIVYMKKKDFQKAESDFTEVLKLNPKDPDALYDRVVSYINLDKRKEALTDLDLYISINPNNADVFGKRGVMRFTTGDTTGACQDWKKALSLGSSAAKDALELYCK